MNIYVKGLRESRSIAEDLAIFKSAFRNGDDNDVSEMAIYVASISMNKKRVSEALHLISLMSETMSDDDKAVTLFTAFSMSYHGTVGSDVIDERFGMTDEMIDMFYLNHGF